MMAARSVLIGATLVLLGNCGFAGEPTIRALTPFDPDPENPELQENPVFEEDAFLKLEKPIAIGGLKITAWRNLHDPTKKGADASPKRVELLVNDTVRQKTGWLPLELGQTYGPLKFSRLDYRPDAIDSPEAGIAAVITTDLSLLIINLPEEGKRFLILRTFSGESGPAEGFFSDVAHPEIAKPQRKANNGEQLAPSDGEKPPN